jgi:type IV secretion system protein TrbG
MKNKYILAISLCALMAFTNAEAKAANPNHKSSDRKQAKTLSKVATKSKPKSNSPMQVPAIGAQASIANTPIINPLPPAPDSVVTEKVALERKSVPPPPANLMSGKNATLTHRENAGMAIAKSFSNNQVMPTRGDEGVIVFPFGETMPSIVCAPLIVCDITLQAGEIVNDINVGDAVRWKLSPATSGSGMNTTTHVIVKPTDAALQTNAIITTDRRTYVLKLVSRRTDYMARISFTYSEDNQEQWRNYRLRFASSQDIHKPTQNPLNFNYVISGDKPKWRPIRIYNDNLKTYIEFPEAIKTTEAPALLVLDDNSQEQLVNYRIIGTRYIIDKIFDNAELIGGTGNKQTKVTIARKE